MNTHKSKIHIHVHLNDYKHTKKTNLPQLIYPLGQLGSIGKKYLQLKNLMQVSVTNQYIIY